MKITPELVMLALAAPPEPPDFEPVMATPEPGMVWDGVPFDRQPKDEEDYEGDWDRFESKEAAVLACGEEWVCETYLGITEWRKERALARRLQWKWAWAVEMLEAGERYLEGRAAR